MSDKAVGWVRQAPGKALEWLGSIDTGGTTGYNPGLKSRLIITKDISKSQVSLSVSSVTTEDSATYYCTAVHQKTSAKSCPGGYSWRFGCPRQCGRTGRYCVDGRGVCDCSTYGGDTASAIAYTYELHVDAWGQGLLVTVSSEGESHPRV
nr:immunoglobulin mu heavy chain [Bos taurus]